jgi:hypothetical protein
MASVANLIEAIAILDAKDLNTENPKDVAAARRVVSNADKKELLEARKKFNSSTATKMPKRNKGGVVKKKKLAKGGFPDLSGDGKVTKKDVLIGSGVKMNKGGMNKKMPAYGKGGLKPAKSTYNMGGMKKQYGVKNYMYGGSVMGKKKK